MQACSSSAPRWAGRVTWARALMALVALALSWLGAATAQAATAEQCAAAVAGRASVPPPAAATTKPDGWEGWMCGLEPTAELPPSAVPMCLIEGASAVAPRPIFPVDGARAEAVRPCPERDGGEQWTSSAPREQPPAPPSAAHDGVLPPTPPVPPAAAEPLVLCQPPTGPGPAGVTPGVYRPPRH